MAWTRTFADEGQTIDEVGGKALNLARLTLAGFPVPAGFTVTTDAFRATLEDAGLGPRIVGVLADLEAEDPAATDRASEQIRAAWAGVRIPDHVAGAVLRAYEALGSGPVAVRSSATTEDLPDLSFAGQQDTVLGVVGEEALLAALTTCWSSLWTARAITYRRRAGIPEQGAAIAVAVQRLVPADSSGVLFTANPLTGHRGEMTVDATFGLGEALVSGRVDPDHVVADATTGRVLRRTVGTKAVVTSVTATGQVQTQAAGRVSRPALTDEEVRLLVELGRQVQEELGGPQDIEWATHEGRIWLLQARPVTSLFPLPEPGGAVPDTASPTSVWLSFGAVQGMLEPISPLGRDAIRGFLTGGATALGATLPKDDNPWLKAAGERLWIRVDRALRNPLGARVLPSLLVAVDPSARRIILELQHDGELPPLPASTLRAVAPRLVRLGRLAGRNLLRAARDPWAVRSEFDQVTEAVVDHAVRAFASAAAEPDPGRRAELRASALRTSLARVLAAVIPYAGVVIAGPMLTLRLLTRLAHEQDEGDHGVSPLVLEITRALPDNVTTQMDLQLWEVAAAVRADPEARRLVESLAPAELAARYAAAGLPAGAAAALGRFLDAYGMRGVGEIDVARPRWRDDPADVLATVRTYLDIPPGQAPPEQFERGERAAEAAVEQLARQAGPVRGRAVRFLAGRVRALAGGRELPKFTIVRLLGVAREALLQSGRDLVESGMLDSADDVFLLRLGELERVRSMGLEAVRATVAQRRLALARERRRGQVPRILLGDGRAFYEGLGNATGDDGEITGSPVSPGVVEGPVRVVLDPARAELRQGEILVCPGTDPAWTPLFLTAGGLVTEVGGMMTHGSVVAREYGIPAVVGVHEATTRLRTGQRIRLNGTAGTIALLDEEREPAAEQLPSADAYA